MKYIIDKTVICAAMNKHGFEQQMDMLAEECLELALAIRKARRNNGLMDKEYRANIIDEVADVNIMLEQVNMMFSTTAIQKRIYYKIQRLKNRLTK